MNSLYIIGCAAGGGMAGFVAGWLIGEAEGGDFNIAPAFYAPIGGLIGGAIGVVAGAIIFT